MVVINVSPLFPEITDEIKELFAKAYSNSDILRKKVPPDLHILSHLFKETLFNNGIKLTGYADQPLTEFELENVVKAILLEGNMFYFEGPGNLKNDSQAVLFKEMESKNGFEQTFRRFSA